MKSPFPHEEMISNTHSLANMSSSCDRNQACLSEIRAALSASWTKDCDRVARHSTSQPAWFPIWRRNGDALVDAVSSAETIAEIAQSIREYLAQSSPSIGEQRIDWLRRLCAAIDWACGIPSEHATAHRSIMFAAHFEDMPHLAGLIAVGDPLKPSRKEAVHRNRVALAGVIARMIHDPEQDWSWAIPALINWMGPVPDYRSLQKIGFPALNKYAPDCEINPLIVMYADDIELCQIGFLLRRLDSCRPGYISEFWHRLVLRGGKYLSTEQFRWIIYLLPGRGYDDYLDTVTSVWQTNQCPMDRCHNFLAALNLPGDQYQADLLAESANHLQRSGASRMLSLLLEMSPTDISCERLFDLLTCIGRGPWSERLFSLLHQRTLGYDAVMWYSGSNACVISRTMAPGRYCYRLTVDERVLYIYDPLVHAWISGSPGSCPIQGELVELTPNRSIMNSFDPSCISQQYIVQGITSMLSSRKSAR